MNRWTVFSLSVIIICDFFLDLRQANERSLQTAHIQSLSWSFAGAQNALRFIHDTIIFDMGESPGENDEEPQAEELAW